MLRVCDMFQLQPINFKIAIVIRPPLVYQLPILMSTWNAVLRKKTNKVVEIKWCGSEVVTQPLHQNVEEQFRDSNS